jgi:SAM-dependent methyltransferase
MAQNIYDDAAFFAGYSRLPRSVAGLAGAPEWPALRVLLPELRGRRVLDLGCGFGWFCRYAREQGAARVLGIDVSARMLARAHASTHDAAITYRRADLEEEDLELSRASFDLVFSSLVFHYLVQLEGLLAQVAQALVPGGRLVCSVEHPLYTAPSAAHPTWSVDAAGHKTWPLASYLEEGPRVRDWLTQGVVKQHRTFATYLTLLLRRGFTLTHIEEWGPTDEQLAAQPQLADERQRPTFLFLAAQRPR